MPDESADQRPDTLLGMLFSEGVLPPRSETGSDAGALEGGLPASPDQIALLERHWRRRLPPIYRRMLALRNGHPRLWFDAALLSIDTIIDGGPEMRAFETAGPEYWRWIFASGTELRDALAFAPNHAAEQGEMQVVQLGAAGVVARWPSLHDLVTTIANPCWGVRGCGTTTCYLWTGLWRYWCGNNSPHSRTFTASSNVVQYAGRASLFVQHCDIDTARLLPEVVLAEADRRFAHGVCEIGDAEPGFAIVLTEAPSERAATQGYVYYEPFADLVVALGTKERKASICATRQLWKRWGPSFESLISSATELLRRGRVAEALLQGIDETWELFRRMHGARRA
jgi:hypothetical protein